MKRYGGRTFTPMLLFHPFSCWPEAGICWFVGLILVPWWLGVVVVAKQPWQKKDGTLKNKHSSSLSRVAQVVVRQLMCHIIICNEWHITVDNPATPAKGKGLLQVPNWSPGPIPLWPSPINPAGCADLCQSLLMCPPLIIWPWQAAHLFELEKNEAQAKARDLCWKLLDITNQEEEGSTSSNNGAPPSKRSQKMMTWRNLRQHVRKLRLSMRVTILLCFTCHSFDWEMECLRWNINLS